MTRPGTAARFVGASVRRKEDPRLLTGRGRYTADLAPPHMVSAVVVRSSRAHAVIREIDTRRARAVPGVLDTFTFQDVKHCVTPIPLRMSPRPELGPYLQYPLAEERVRYVGEPVAVVVAENPYVAEDASELVEVEYEPLPAVVDAERGMRPDSAMLFPEGNVAASWTVEMGDVDEAFRAAAHVLRRRFAVQRHTGVPMETRGLVAEWDAGRRVLTVWGVTKVPYFNRQALAAMLRLGEDRIHFVEPDVGGAFGVRGEFYPEDFLIPFAAMRVGRPVRWVEDRREHFLSINHSREQSWELAVAADGAGHLLGIDATLINDMGAYVRTHGTMVPSVSAAHLHGPYHVAHYRCRVACVMTNKTPTGTLRSPGLYECDFVRERALDMIAAEIGMDPAELRRRNLVRPDQMPYNVGISVNNVPVVFDTGDFPSIFDRALDGAGYRRLLEECRVINAKGSNVRAGVGLACFVEPTGRGPFESAKVQLTSAGTIQVCTGATSQGQGQETTLAQVSAEVLQVPLEDVVVRHGDTELMPYGVGTYAARAAVMAGSAVLRASEKLRDKILRLAAAHLEVSPSDLRLQDARVSVLGVPDRGYSLKDVAALAGPMTPPLLPETEGPLEAVHFHRTTEMTASFVVHVAVVTVDTDTGIVTPRRYAVVCDVGRAINPMIVEGQIVGGAVQGLGGALLEELVYDEHGQLVTTSFMDYLVPGIVECPEFDVTILEEGGVVSNPLGVKGAGESGTSGVGAAIGNAVVNALGPRADITRLPLHPSRLLAVVAGSR